jgi:hypothetical protein
MDDPVGDSGGIAGPVAVSGAYPPSPSQPPSQYYSSQVAWSQPRLRYPPHVKADTVPGPRAAHSCNLIGSKLYAFGGWNGRSGLNDLHTLDVDTLEWSVPLTSGPTPSTRNNHATFVYGSRLFVHGGHDGLKWLADLHCLDTEKMEWSQPAVSGVHPSARACHTTTLLGRKVRDAEPTPTRIIITHRTILSLPTDAFLL